MSEAEQHRSRLSSGRLLARNVGLAVLGQGATIVLAFATVPILLHALGTARFGVLTLAWVLIGYAGLFDLGLGRALTKMTSEQLGAGREGDIPALFWTSLGLMAVLGVVGLFVVGGLSAWLATHAIHMPESLRGEAVAAFALLALSIPAVLVSSMLRGFLEAYQRFDMTNGVTVAISIISFGGPAVVVQFVPTLPAAVGVVVLSRYIACAITFVLARRVAPELAHRVPVRRRLARRMLGYGGWVTATSLGASVIDSLDRLLIGAVLTASAVAYYATPYQAVSRLLILSVALVGVLFPAFALTIGEDQARTVKLFGQGLRFAFLALFPFVLVVIALAPELLSLWLGGEFPARSSFPMRAFAIGILFNGAAQIVFGLLQSHRPDLPAKLYFIQLPFYVAGLLFALHAFGIAGAAVAFSLRVIIDAVLLAVAASRSVPAVRPVFVEVGGLLSGGTGVLFLAWFLPGVVARSVALAAGLALYALVGWRSVLRDDERAALRDRVPRRRDRAVVGPPPVVHAPDPR